VKEIGEYLRQVRTEKNITLDAIQETTKIRKHYLEAIENGNFEAIPGEVYRKGFLVNYANAIGLDGQEVLERYNRLKEPKVEPVEMQVKIEPEIKKEPEVKQEPKTPKKKTNTRIRLKSSANLWVFAAIVLAIIVAWVAIPMIQERTLKLESASNSNAALQPVTKSTPKQQQSVTPSETENPEPTASPEIVSTQIYPAPVTVYAEFSGDVWVQVIADGKAILVEDGQTFHADSPKQVWTAQKELKINIGNPGGIKLSLNGEDLGKIGEWGVSKTITLTPDGLVNQ
jgi:cytoskeletal protein RodZ